jgi:hypothetical protein
MAIVIEMQNTGDSDVRRDMVAIVENLLSIVQASMSRSSSGLERILRQAAQIATCHCPW